MSDAEIKHMVQRFLSWRLPESFRPDAGISFKAEFNEHTAHPMRHEPTGTNLFDATQAEAMVRYMVDGLPTGGADLATVREELEARMRSEIATLELAEKNSDLATRLETELAEARKERDEARRAEALAWFEALNIPKDARDYYDGIAHSLSDVGRAGVIARSALAAEVDHWIRQQGAMAVRVCEGGGPENLAASFSVTAHKVSDARKQTAAERNLAEDTANALRSELARERARAEEAVAEFKNFHRNLCERFGYVHDEVDWKRDQCSLEEYIATRVGDAALRSALEEAKGALERTKDILERHDYGPRLRSLGSTYPECGIEHPVTIDIVTAALASISRALGSTAGEGVAKP